MEIDTENKIWFRETKYDSNDLLEIENNYSEGKKFKISKTRWGIKNELEVENEVVCDTFEKFCETIWDLFSDICEKNALNFIAPFGLKNNNPYRPSQIYFDGLSLYQDRRLFLECLLNQDISHFYSFVKRHGYSHIKIELI